MLQSVVSKNAFKYASNGEWSLGSIVLSSRLAVYVKGEQFGCTYMCTILLYFMVLVSFEEDKVHGEVSDSCSS